MSIFLWHGLNAATAADSSVRVCVCVCERVCRCVCILSVHGQDASRLDLSTFEKTQYHCKL